MPHLIIESNLPIDDQSLQSLHDELGRQETVKIEAVKTRFINVEKAFKGTDAEGDHIAILIKLLQGRPSELKQQIATNIHNKAQSLLPGSSITVEVVDLGEYVK